MSRTERHLPPDSGPPEPSSLGNVLGEAAWMFVLVGLTAVAGLMAFTRTGNPRPVGDAAAQSRQPAAFAAYQAPDLPCPLPEVLAFYIVVGGAADSGTGSASNGAAVASATEATMPALVALVLDGNRILTAMGQPELVPIVIRVPV